ncbi:sam (and some other nucleotide) binding motif [Stylonychia lemnae]|uniref:Sam (And some other nucleotide) binding motif n=1 Tax=Stylonychia lemnae TaxID=5949 RepID=A0A078ABP8_STYLE|nr:sam (and some other nucleotide) binding motif [Stylonychia lemnae]|eukprot:CDW79720.1 sam (and some other nucleotide) binding motif [Stylonychia lemnae]
MENSGKDMFGFDGQSSIYAAIRPTYPKVFYEQLEEAMLQSENGWRICLDIGTGTGQVAAKLASKFRHIYGLDISDKQLQQAREVNSNIDNLTFHNCSVYDIQQFVEDNKIDGEIDLIIMGEVFHWFEPQRALHELHQVANKSGSLVVIWSYIQFSILNSNIHKDCIEKNEQYLTDFKEIIYNKSLQFTTPIQNSDDDIKTNAQMVLDFLLSTSGYRVLLEKEGITLGDIDQDPAMILKKEIQIAYQEYQKQIGAFNDGEENQLCELKDINLFIGWPFFSIMLKIKNE